MAIKIVEIATMHNLVETLVSSPDPQYTGGDNGDLWWQKSCSGVWVHHCTDNHQKYCWGTTSLSVSI